MKPRNSKIPVVALTDTNCDPDGIDFLIPGNDDAIRAIKLIASLMAEAVIEGKARRGEEEGDVEEMEAAMSQDSAEETLAATREKQRERELTRLTATEE